MVTFKGPSFKDEVHATTVDYLNKVLAHGNCIQMSDVSHFVNHKFKLGMGEQEIADLLEDEITNKLYEIVTATSTNDRQVVYIQKSTK